VDVEHKLSRDFMPKRKQESGIAEEILFGVLGVKF
jgi:hypothetical protein